MGDDQKSDLHRRRRREYAALLIGIPLLLIGVWGLANAYYGINSRRPMPDEIRIIGIAGAVAFTSGGFLIYRAR
jgi:hypothetical protein